MSQEPPHYPPNIPTPGVIPPQPPGQYPPATMQQPTYAPYPTQPYQPPRQSGLRTCLIVGLVALVVLALIGGGMLLLFGKRVRNLVERQILEPQRAASEFIDAAGRGQLGRMRELSDPNHVSKAELEQLVEFVHEYCGQILSKEFKNHNFKSTADGATYQIEVTVKCSKANFDAELELRSRGMSSPIVTGARWRTA